MMSKYLLLLLIPIVYGQIAIQITAGQTDSDSSVEYTGEDTEIISDTERKSFNIEDRSLKEAAGKYSGRVPTDVFVKSPTPWEDIYHKCNWEQVQRTLIPIRSRVMGIHTKPVIVSTREFENYSQVKGKYGATISHQVEQTFTSSWSKEKELTGGQSISFNVNFGAGSFGGTTSLSYTAKWGNESSEAKTVILGTTTNMEVELKPGQAVVATLTATHGTLDIEVDYEAYLTGQIIANYDPKFDGHMWWAYPIHFVLKAAGLPNKVTSTEKISIGFFTSAKVVMRDKYLSNKIVKVAPAGIISSHKLLKKIP